MAGASGVVMVYSGSGGHGYLETVWNYLKTGIAILVHNSGLSVLALSIQSSEYPELQGFLVIAEILLM